jgi:zinc transporter ZupT
MRYGYWWIEALLGVALIVAPFVEKFVQFRPATYTDVILGILLVVWAVVGYWLLGGTESRGAHPGRA